MRLFDQYPTLRKVIVNLKTDRAFRGVLWKKRRRYVVLRNAELLKGQGETVPMDGEVLIMSDNIDFVQVL